MADRPIGSDRGGSGPPRLRYQLLVAASGKFGLLLLALVGLMAMTPLILGSPANNALLTCFTGAVLVAGLHASRPGRRAIVVGIALTLVDYGTGRATVWLGSRWVVFFQLALWLATMIYLIASILGSIFESEEVTIETLQASLCVYLLIGLAGTFALGLIDFLLPGSFLPAKGPTVDWSDRLSRAAEFLRLFVLSYATLAGTSDAEFAPATGFASNALALESMAGQIYLAVIIARLVGLHASRPRP